MCQLSPDKIRVVLTDISDNTGIKGLHAVKPLIFLQHTASSFRDCSRIIAISFDLYDQWNAAINQLEYIGKQRNGLLSSLKPVVDQFRSQHLFDFFIHASRPFQGRIVNDRKLPISKQMHIQFHTVACLSSLSERTHTVFRVCIIVQSTVCVRPISKCLQLFVSRTATEHK